MKGERMKEIGYGERSLQRSRLPRSAKFEEGVTIKEIRRSKPQTAIAIP
jgi:hypothetical protein